MNAEHAKRLIQESGFEHLRWKGKGPRFNMAVIRMQGAKEVHDLYIDGDEKKVRASLKELKEKLAVNVPPQP